MNILLRLYPWQWLAVPGTPLSLEMAWRRSLDIGHTVQSHRIAATAWCDTCSSRKMHILCSNQLSFVLKMRVTDNSGKRGPCQEICPAEIFQLLPSEDALSPFASNQVSSMAKLSRLTIGHVLWQGDVRHLPLPQGESSRTMMARLARSAVFAESDR